MTRFVVALRIVSSIIGNMKKLFKIIVALSLFGMLRCLQKLKQGGKQNEKIR